MYQVLSVIPTSRFAAPPPRRSAVQMLIHRWAHGRKGRSSEGKAAPALTAAGLSEILFGPPLEGEGRQQMLGMKRTLSRARGMADSMESTPTYEKPSRSAQCGMTQHGTA